MEQYIERNETYAKHLFDGMKFNVYETEYINLSAGLESNYQTFH